MTLDGHSVIVVPACVRCGQFHCQCTAPPSPTVWLGLWNVSVTYLIGGHHA